MQTTKTAAICRSLLSGKKITIMDGFTQFFVTNLPREIGRGIERKFGVKVERTKKLFTSTVGIPGYYFEYKLKRTPGNEPGIERMREYIKKHRAKA